MLQIPSIRRNQPISLDSPLFWSNLRSFRNPVLKMSWHPDVVFALFWSIWKQVGNPRILIDTWCGAFCWKDWICLMMMTHHDFGKLMILLTQELWRWLVPDGSRRLPTVWSCGPGVIDEWTPIAILRIALRVGALLCLDTMQRYCGIRVIDLLRGHNTERSAK